MLQADHADNTGGLDVASANDIEARLNALDDHVVCAKGALAALFDMIELRTVNDRLPFVPVAWIADRIKENVAAIEGARR